MTPTSCAARALLSFAAIHSKATSNESTIWLLLVVSACSALMRGAMIPIIYSTLLLRAHITFTALISIYSIGFFQPPLHFAATWYDRGPVSFRVVANQRSRRCLHGNCYASFLLRFPWRRATCSSLPLAPGAAILERGGVAKPFDVVITTECCSVFGVNATVRNTYLATVFLSQRCLR